MEIFIFGNYKVKYKNKYSYILDKIDDEYLFSNDKAEWVKEMDGYSFIKFLIGLIEDREFFSIVTNENLIIIDHFDPCSGETSYIRIEFEEIFK